MTDGKDRFLQAVAEHPDTLYTVYFGTKAAPLTKAHEEIIETLVRHIIAAWGNYYSMRNSFPHNQTTEVK